MEVTHIEPATWTTVLGTLAGALLPIILAALGVVMFWLRNVKAKLDIQHALLMKQQHDLQENTATTAIIEKQTNGALEAARNEATKYRSGFERLSWILREVNANEQGREIIDGVMQRHRVVIHDESYDALMRSLMSQEPKK